MVSVGPLFDKLPSLPQARDMHPLPGVPSRVASRPGHPEQIPKRDSRAVPFGQFLGHCLRNTRFAKPTVEDQLCPPPPPQARYKDSDQRAHQTRDEESDRQAFREPFQSSSPSFSRPIHPPRSNPLLPIRSRRLIMYPLAMSSASSFGIPASTSLV